MTPHALSSEEAEFIMVVLHQELTLESIAEASTLPDARAREYVRLVGEGRALIRDIYERLRSEGLDPITATIRAQAGWLVAFQVGEADIQTGQRRRRRPSGRQAH